MEKIGYLENSNGEKSHTKLINSIVALAIMGGWAMVCYQKGELVQIDPTLLGLLGMCISGNSLNKWIESNSNVEKAKMIRTFMERVKK